MKTRQRVTVLTNRCPGAADFKNTHAESNRLAMICGVVGLREVSTPIHICWHTISNVFGLTASQGSISFHLRSSSNVGLNLVVNSLLWEKSQTNPAAAIFIIRGPGNAGFFYFFEVVVL